MNDLGLVLAYAFGQLVGLVAAAAVIIWLSGCAPIAWNEAKWLPGNDPIEVLLEPSLSDCWQKETAAAIDHINAATGRQLLIAKPATAMAVPAHGQILVTQGPLGTRGCPPNTLCELAGWAQITSHVAGRIMAAKLTLTDRQRMCTLRVAAHELGHALGLGHRDERASTMYGSAVSGAWDWHAESVAHMQGQR